MKRLDLTDQEVDEVLNLIKYSFGCDFTSYSKASIHRRIHRFMDELGIMDAFDLKHYLLNTTNVKDFLIEHITVNVTEMFRDPDFYRAMKEKVLTMLASYPIVNIWHAGCASGEEVFSMAILFHEAGLLQRTRIYATDINPAILAKAKKGIIPLDVMKDYTANYIKSGGVNDFASYYTARYNNAIINKEIRKNIVFLQHNLVTDGGFNEFQLICCRNVMIYFNKQLQNRVVTLLHDNLSSLGYLALGTKESLIFTTLKNEFDIVDMQQKIFRRKH